MTPHPAVSTSVPGDEGTAKTSPLPSLERSGPAQP